METEKTFTYLPILKLTVFGIAMNDAMNDATDSESLKRPDLRVACILRRPYARSTATAILTLAGQSAVLEKTCWNTYQEGLLHMRAPRGHHLHLYERLMGVCLFDIHLIVAAAGIRDFGNAPHDFTVVHE